MLAVEIYFEGGQNIIFENIELAIETRDTVLLKTHMCLSISEFVTNIPITENPIEISAIKKYTRT